MRTHGTLVKWNDARGFGFVAVASGSEEVFVHVSAFPRDGSPPRVGELISFDIHTGADGKRKALRVQRAGASPVREDARRQRDPGRRAEPRGGGRAPSPMKGIAVMLSIVAIGAYAFTQLRPAPTVSQAELQAAPRAQPLASGESFICDGRTTCSQMRSCAEAEFFLAHCPGTELDGNNDGEPCEQQWCN